MKKNLSAVQLDLGTVPLIEMSGNRRVNVEGSTGILLYETSNIKVSTNRMVLSFEGRGLSERCITGSWVAIEGYITQLE